MTDTISLPVKMLAAAAKVTVDEMVEFLLRKGTGKLESWELRPAYIRKALADENGILIKSPEAALKKLPKVEIDEKRLYTCHGTFRRAGARNSSIVTLFPMPLVDRIAKMKEVSLDDMCQDYMLEYTYGDYDFVLVQIVPRARKKKSRKIADEPIDTPR